MGSRQTQVDRAIAKLDADIARLTLAKETLIACKEMPIARKVATATTWKKKPKPAFASPGE